AGAAGAVGVGLGDRAGGGDDQVAGLAGGGDLLGDREAQADRRIDVRVGDVRQVDHRLRRGALVNGERKLVVADAELEGRAGRAVAEVPAIDQAGAVAGLRGGQI